MAKDILAFDSKDFKREKYTNILGEKQKYTQFYSPLGVGVSLKHDGLFETDYLKTIAKYAESFGFPLSRPFFSSSSLKREMGLGLRKAIPFCDQIVKELESYIRFIHISYVILPPTKIPTVFVGGEKCPKIEIKTIDFLRKLSPSFVYLTAWSMGGKWDLSKYDVLLDGFRSKETYAWNQLIEMSNPKVFPKGDECNPFISFADILAFLTDIKLYNAKKDKRQLNPDNIAQAWDDYDFDINVRFLDESGLKNYKWHKNDLIDYNKFLARPALFLMIDSIEKIGLKEEKDIDPAQTELEVPDIKPQKFRQVLRKMEPFHSATHYAYLKGGCVQFFDRYTDADKIQDGDIIVYMGRNSKHIAETYQDGFDLEVMSAKELREKIKKL